MASIQTFVYDRNFCYNKFLENICVNKSNRINENSFKHTSRYLSDQGIIRTRMRLQDDTNSKYLFFIGQYGNPLTKYIRHYEGLSYDVDSLHQKHQRAKRAVSHEDQFLRLDFHAHGR